MKFFCFSLLFFAISAWADKPLKDYCLEDLKKFPGKINQKLFEDACGKVEVIEGCKSVNGHPIYHFNKEGDHHSKQKILVISLIHGDEIPAGTAVRLWLERLADITPRNHWRVIPMLNPDGVVAKTRTNANKIDINRNFPTKDWEETAVKAWKTKTKSNPRRFPGDTAASEPETKCAVKHIEEFQPNFIVSIHTPLKVLDFDGPKIKPPKYDYLPWKSLGHFPGSLGRYMWHDRKIPTLTMELKEDLPQTMQPLIQLQDIIGYLVSLEPGKKKASAPKKEPTPAKKN